ncbi:MAG: hypothetical protein ACT6TH_07610 [Brevundimonas sp.]|uniref:hypothetical protein n=1 Tax=Brevundimonas sp. TaxID=1871086 RepID=UPI00403484F6
MKVTLLGAAFLLAAGSAAAQTPPAAPQADTGASVTRDLNSGPPRPATYLAPAPSLTSPAPAVTAPAPRTTPEPSNTPAPASVAPAPSPARPAASTPRPAPTVVPAPAPRAVAMPEPAAAPAMTPAPRAAATPLPAPSPAPAPTPVPAPVAAPPPAPGVSTTTVLDAPARAALPFTVDLPRGFEIVTGRPGPTFRVYTIRRGERSFAMVYVGSGARFPIYSGETVEAAGRLSLVSTEDGQRHAKEHLFRRDGAPDVHVWTMTLDGEDRAVAERIAQSVDVREATPAAPARP